MTRHRSVVIAVLSACAAAAFMGPGPLAARSPQASRSQSSQSQSSQSQSSQSQASQPQAPQAPQLETARVNGRILGPTGDPLPGQTIVLHRVDASSGITVATGVSDDDGAFRLDVPAAEAAGTGVFFLAARYTDGELYLGDAFRAPFDSTVQHVVHVGTPETSARSIVSVADGEQVTEDPARWLLYMLPLLAIIGFAAVYALGRGRIPPRRRALAEIARLDEQNAGHAEAGYPARRTALLARLGQQAGG